MLIGAVDFDREHDQSSYLGLGPDDSSEIVLEPFLSDGRSVSRCGTAVKSSISMAASARSGVGCDQRGSVLRQAEYLGRFRIVEMLGEGQHATVYRAYDPVLERDVALKVPRQGVIKIGQGAREVLGRGQGTGTAAASSDRAGV